MRASAHPDLGTWCLRTKKQGIAGYGAPRQCRCRPIRTWGRGASGRRNKGLRGMEHHVSAGVGPSGPGDVVLPDEGIRDCGGVKHHVCEGVGPSGPVDVVPPDEGIRDCGGWSTTSVRAAAHPDLGTWCFLRPGTLVSRNERSRCTKCTAASSIYYAFLGLQVQRRSPRRPATPHSARQRLAKFGEAHAARQRPASPATPHAARQRPRPVR